ncbi:cyclic nucleotide-binding-like protein [Chytridium lagenaria]|nr:cyclic nucleotide-binding-like protein [Chytridium lagenaria]
MVHSCLRNLPAFRKINSDFIFNQLCTKATIQELPRGTIIFNQGDPGESWHVILTGRVNILVSKGFDLHQKSHISTLSSGEALGLKALVNDSPRTATAITETPVTLLRVAKTDYKNLLGFLHMIEPEGDDAFLAT